jgi:hypothetical protein
MRAKGSLERDIMLGQVVGYRRQGKPRMRWLDSWPMIGGFERNSTRQEKVAHAGGRKVSE